MVSFEEFEFALSSKLNKEFDFEDTYEFYYEYFQNNLSLNKNIDLFLKWIEVV